MTEQNEVAKTTYRGGRRGTRFSIPYGSLCPHTSDSEQPTPSAQETSTSDAISDTPSSAASSPGESGADSSHPGR